MFKLLNFILNHRNINLIYFKNTEINIHNILIMIEDFNIRDNNWNLFYSHHLVYNDVLLEVANFFNLKFFYPVNQVLTQYTDNPNDTNLVIDIMFL